MSFNILTATGAQLYQYLTSVFFICLRHENSMYFSLYSIHDLLLIPRVISFAMYTHVYANIHGILSLKVHRNRARIYLTKWQIYVLNDTRLATFLPTGSHVGYSVHEPFARHVMVVLVPLTLYPSLQIIAAVTPTIRSPT